jgi:TPR repeat protein
MNICNKCKGATYCNASCKKKHRKQHKKKCEQRVAELHEEALFKEPPRKEDCPICFIRIPTLTPGGWVNQSCCSKCICNGCSYAQEIRQKNGGRLCPFCRTPTPNSENEMVRRVKEKVEIATKHDEIDGAEAIYGLGNFYFLGAYGVPQDYNKAFELFYQAGELGHAQSYSNLAIAYIEGRGVEIDTEKAVQLWERGAMLGDAFARYNLAKYEEMNNMKNMVRMASPNSNGLVVIDGTGEATMRNWDRALKHHMIAVRGGYAHSVYSIKNLYLNGFAKKEDYAEAIRAYHAYLEDIMSDQRDQAAAASDEFKYYLRLCELESRRNLRLG